MAGAGERGRQPWKPDRTDDPRRLGGNIVGGTPHGDGDALIDTTNAVIVDFQEVVTMTNPSDDRRFIGLVLSGRINRTKDRTRVLYLLNEDGAAAVVSEMIAMASRGGFKQEFLKRITERAETLADEGND